VTEEELQGKPQKHRGFRECFPWDIYIPWNINARKHIVLVTTRKGAALPRPLQIPRRDELGTASSPQFLL
jgi:hypothetical protein